jgi:RimJ/RimL family protein N-acetyltransferase
VQPAALRLERLELVPLTPACIEALLAGERTRATALLGASLPQGWPDEQTARFLGTRLEQLEREPAAAEWGVRGAVRRAEATLVGHIGFHGPPGVNGLARAGALELGYTIFPGFRRRGYALEAASGLLAWALQAHGVGSFLASVAPDNDASLGLVERLGFRPIGEQWDDEDGLELVFELFLAAS